MKNERHTIDDIQVAAYLDGRLAAHEQGVLEQSLKEGDGGASLLRLVQAVATGESPPDAGPVPMSVVRRVIAQYPSRADVLDLVLSLAHNAISVVRAAADVRIGFPSPALSFRSRPPGNGSLIVMQKNIGTMVAEVDVERLSGTLCNIAIFVQDAKNKTPAGRLRVELVSNGRELGSCALERGRALFEDVGTGRYELVLRDRGAPCGTMRIKIQ